jgi:hypothetical protein
VKEKFPGFQKCMAMMRKHNPQTQEDGFHWLVPHAGEYVHQLIEEFGKEKRHGLRCWLIELIGVARSPDAFEFLAGLLRNDDERFRFWAIVGLKKLSTKEARTLLWQAHSFTLASSEETEAFRSDLDTVLNKYDW